MIDPGGATANVFKGWTRVIHEAVAPTGKGGKMPNKCKCGGDYYQVWETRSAFAVRCNKCKAKHIQRKRRAKKIWA